MQVDLLHALDLAGLYETAELGDGLPLLLVALTTSTASATAATATPATITSTVAARAETTATVAAGSTASISHICGLDGRVEGGICRLNRCCGVAVVRSQLGCSPTLGEISQSGWIRFGALLNFPSPAGRTLRRVPANAREGSSGEACLARVARASRSASHRAKVTGPPTDRPLFPGQQRYEILWSGKDSTRSRVRTWKLRSSLTDRYPYRKTCHSFTFYTYLPNCQVALH